jgi:uncharacterized protein (TIGR02147 family)
MRNIFSYTDYRQYLADYYQEKKKAAPSFSYQNFSRKSGFASKSFIFNVIQGKKNLSRSSIVQIGEAMGLCRTEAAYFEKLVFFNQAATFKERNYYFEQLNSVHARESGAGKIKQLRQDQFEFYSQWHHAAIRSLIDLYDFNDDYQWLAKALNPSITPRDAKKSVRLLERLRLIEKGKGGYYKVCEKLITTGRDVQGLAIQHLHAENMKLAENAMKGLPKDKRNVSGLTLGISKETYGKICDVIYEAQDRILSMAEKDDKADGVYQCNFQLFPVTKNNLNGGKR